MNDARAAARSIPFRTLLLAAAVALLAAAVVSISDTLILVFLGVFLALVFEVPLRTFVRWTGWGRGISATIVVLGSTVVVTVLALLLLVPLVGALRDFVKSLPEIVDQLRNSDELSWAGDSGGAENVQQGATNLADSVPHAISSILGIAGDAFSVGLAIFTLIFLALFLLIDMDRLRGVVRAVLMPADAERWLDTWERITETVSRWAIGALTIAVIAGTVQGGTAWLLGSSYALALGVIAGFLDLIPNLGATIAGFILVPTILAEEGLTDALIMLAVVLVYQQIENNLLGPDDLREGSEHLAVLRDPRRDDLRSAARGAGRSRRCARDRIAADRRHRGDPDAPCDGRRGARSPRGLLCRARRRGRPLVAAAPPARGYATASVPDPPPRAAFPAERSLNAKMTSVIPRMSAITPTQMTSRIALRPQ